MAGIQLLPELVSNHFQPGMELASFEAMLGRWSDSAFTLDPARRIGIAHDLADVIVTEQRLDGPEKWNDDLETHAARLGSKSTACCWNQVRCRGMKSGLRKQ